MKKGGKSLRYAFIHGSKGRGVENPHTQKIATVSLLLLLALSTTAVFALPARATSPTCVSAGSTGLTAAVVLTSGQHYSGTLDATGCDVGIYVGPGATGVVIAGATVTGANDHGIFVQDASGIVIRDSTVSGNGVNPNAAIAENKGIELVGTTNSLVSGNTVENNLADGGIGIADDGPAVDPGAPIASAASPMAGTGNVVTRNYVYDNAFGCGIVVAAYNSGAGVSNNLVSKNTVIGGFDPVLHLPYVGGIVVAADSPFTTVTQNVVLSNTITGSLIPGIVVHSNAPGDVVSGTQLIGNTISKNGNEGPPNDPTSPTGIEVVAEVSPGEPNAPVVMHTQILSQAISDNTYGVWLCYSAATHIAHLRTANVATPTATCDAGGS